MEYGNLKTHTARARNVKARAKRALLLPSTFITSKGLNMDIQVSKWNYGYKTA